jgi:hypothetical protein
VALVLYMGRLMRVARSVMSIVAFGKEASPASQTAEQNVHHGPVVGFGFGGLQKRSSIILARNNDFTFWNGSTND